MATRKDDEGEGRGEFVYGISVGEEWEGLKSSGSTYGGELDKSTGCIHLSDLHQVQSTLENFFQNTTGDLFLLQIDTKKLGEGVVVVYESVDGTNYFPHLYGPSRGFAPLPLDAFFSPCKCLIDKLALRRLHCHMWPENFDNYDPN